MNRLSVSLTSNFQSQSKGFEKVWNDVFKGLLAVSLISQINNYIVVWRYVTRKSFSLYNLEGLLLTGRCWDHQIIH